MTLGIRTKLFLISLGLIVVSVVLAYTYVGTQLTHGLTSIVRDTMTVNAELVAFEAARWDAPPEDEAAWKQLAEDLSERSRGRVTLVNIDGRLLADSALPRSALPPRLDGACCPEIQAALRGEQGEHERASDDEGPPALFIAVPIRRDGQIVGAARVAKSLVEVRATRRELRDTLTIASLLALLVAVVMSSVAAELSSRTARTLTEAARNMAEGDLGTRTRQLGHDEFGELGRALDRMARSLSSTMDQLRNQRDRLSGILSGMQEGVLMLDHEGRVALINPALREMLLLPADSVGKTPLEVIRHAELKEVLDDARRGEPVAREIELGGLKPRRLQVRAARLEGEYSGVFAVFVDVTEMRRLETVRRDFVANVSHELRTPVTAIRSAAETLSIAINNDPRAAGTFVDIIDRNAERLHGLVEDLLDLSRIESRELRLSFEDLDLAQVFAQVLSLFRERADKREIQLIDELPGEFPLARSDRRALEHVLTNLVDNAVKYSGPGSRVRLFAEETNDVIRVSVADDGTGIDKEHLPRLFERFYRVDTGRSRNLGGTGLGLSIVKHLVESMGGRVGVDSEVGQGTTFYFTIHRTGDR